MPGTLAFWLQYGTAHLSGKQPAHHLVAQCHHSTVSSCIPALDLNIPLACFVSGSCRFLTVRVIGTQLSGRYSRPSYPPELRPGPAFSSEAIQPNCFDLHPAASLRSARSCVRGTRPTTPRPDCMSSPIDESIATWRPQWERPKKPGTP